MNAGVICRRTVNLLACLFSLQSLVLQSLGFAQNTVLVPATDGPRQTCAGAVCSGAPGQLSNPAIPSAATSPSAAVGPELNLSRGPNSLDRMTTAEAPPQETEFQDFVATSVGRRLPIYGYSLFEHVPSTFAPIDRVPVTADYVHGRRSWRCSGARYG
jgi:hypothetical protein